MQARTNEPTNINQIKVSISNIFDTVHFNIKTEYKRVRFWEQEETTKYGNKKVFNPLYLLVHYFFIYT